MCTRHEHVSAGGSTKPQKPRLRRRMLQVRAVERLGIEKDGHSVIEGDAVLRRADLGISLVPLEHAFSIYESRDPAGTSDASSHHAVGQGAGVPVVCAGHGPLSGFEHSPVAPRWNRLASFIYKHG